MIEHIKYLGVQVNQYLSKESHITHAIKIFQRF